MTKVLQISFYFAGDDSSEDSIYNEGNKRFIVDPDNKELRSVIKVLINHAHNKFLYDYEFKEKNLNQAKFQTAEVLEWLCQSLDFDSIESHTLFNNLISVCIDYNIWSILVPCIKDKLKDFGEPEDYFDEESDLYELMVNTPSNQKEYTKLLINIKNKGGKHG